MTRFNYVTLVNKQVEIKLVQGNSFKGKVKQVFDDVIVLELEESSDSFAQANLRFAKVEKGDLYLKKDDIISIMT